MTNPQDPAFPSNISNDPQILAKGIHPGLTKREYFAAMALPQVYRSISSDTTTGLREKLVAEVSYKLADAMLAQEEKL